MDIIRAIEQQQIKQDLPEFHVGDNVKVHYRIKEGDRVRVTGTVAEYFGMTQISALPAGVVVKGVPAR